MPVEYTHYRIEQPEGSGVKITTTQTFNPEYYGSIEEAKENKFRQQRISTINFVGNSGMTVLLLGSAQDLGREFVQNFGEYIPIDGEDLKRFLAGLVVSLIGVTFADAARREFRNIRMVRRQLRELNRLNTTT